MASCDRAYNQSWHTKTDGAINRGGTKIDRTIDRTNNRSIMRPIVRSIVATYDRSYDQSWHQTIWNRRLSNSHTGSYDLLIVRLVAIWRTCDRSKMFATISRSRIRRWAFLAGGRSSYDSSYAWSRDQQRLEKIVRIVVAINDRSYDQSWPPAIDRTINHEIMRPIASGVIWGVTRTQETRNVSEQPIGGTTGRKVARPVARLIARPLMIWNRRFQVLNMTIDLVATNLPLAINHDLCDQSYDLCDQL